MPNTDFDIDGFSEYYYLKDYFEYLGYPHLNDSAYANCGIIGLNGGCSKDGESSIPPVAPDVKDLPRAPPT